MIAPNLEELVLLFHPSLESLGQFHEVTAADLGPPFRELLAHEHHMTVTMERHHDVPVELEVIREQKTDDWYAREILLRRASDRRPVQYGIVRLHWRLLPATVRRPIEQHQAPLGRILIEQRVLRQVKLSQLWAIRPSAWLQTHIEQDAPRPLYGRTALLLCDGTPAIELLEVALPTD